jgi:hypothetical protein
VEDVVDTGDVVDEELVDEGVVSSRVHLFQKLIRRGVASNELPFAIEGQ